MNPNPTVARSEWSRGWGLVAASVAGVALYGIAPMLIGLLMKPLQAAFGWQRAEISAMMLIVAGCALVVGPFIGGLIDRFGARRVGLIGVATMCGSLAAVSLAGPQIWTWYALAAVYGVCAQPANAITWTKAIASRFDKHLGLALSVALAGLGVCNLVGPSIALALLHAYGWRGVYVGLAAIAFVIAFSLAFFLLRDASDLALQGGMSRADQKKDRTAFLPGATLGEAARSFRFWIICVTIFFVAACVGGFLIHLQPMLIDVGLTAAQAALLFSIVFGPFSMLGRISIGFFLDRAPPPLISAVAFALPAVASLLLLNHTAGLAWTLTGAVVSGISLGAEIQIVSYLTSRYFGQKHYGSIYGFSYGFYAIGFGLGPVLAAAAFDRTKSYDTFLLTAFVCLAASTIVILFLGKPPVYGTLSADLLPQPELPEGDGVIQIRPA